MIRQHDSLRSLHYRATHPEAHRTWLNWPEEGATFVTKPVVSSHGDPKQPITVLREGGTLVRYHHGVKRTWPVTAHDWAHMADLLKTLQPRHIHVGFSLASRVSPTASRSWDWASNPMIAKVPHEGVRRVARLRRVGVSRLHALHALRGV